MATNETEMDMDTVMDVEDKKEVLMIVGEVDVWSCRDWITPDYIQGLIANGKSDSAVAMLSYSNSDMTGYEGWAHFGRAKVEVTLFPRNVIVENKVESLKAEIQKKRAETQKEVEKLEERIQQLLALPSPNTNTKATNDSEDVVDAFIVEAYATAIGDDPEKGTDEKFRETCPDCYSPLEGRLSGGVRCTNPNCGYWFCF